MTRLEALQALAEEVEAGAAVSSRLYKLAIPEAPDDTYQPLFCGWSMDALSALHEKVLPEWIAKLEIGGAGAGVEFWHCTLENWETGEEQSVHNIKSTPRAWLLAILKALIAQEQAKGNE